MTDRERFKAICRGERPDDYWPIFGFPGAPGMSGPVIEELRLKLIEQGMPASVGVEYSWQKYWGTTGPVYPPFGLALPSKGIQREVRREGEWEIIEYETGARTRQLTNNDAVYTMPDFQAYDVCDRKSWERYRELTRPGGLRPAAEVEADIAAFEPEDRPLVIYGISTWGMLREMMGPVLASTILHDDATLAHEIIQTRLEDFEIYTVPLIERLRPDAIHCGEDICYNHGMLISPQHFEEFCAPAYRRVCEVARDCGVEVVAIDTDGNINDFVPLVEHSGVNGVFPCEPRAGTDLFALRERCPNFVFFGWLEKEVVNEGNEHLIESEIRCKAPRMLETGRYFPNLEHTAQPLSNFGNLCRFMTLLHEVTGNPEGEYPRTY